MIQLLLTLTLLIHGVGQGIGLAASQTGVITGTLKTEAGTPAVGVRVGAMARPENASELSNASALSSIAETDEQGHFRLENIPPGRYYVTAGRVDYPTFFPGTQDITAGRDFQVKAGETISGIDFAMLAIATRPPDTGLFGVAAAAPMSILPVDITIENQSRAPLYAPTGFTRLQLLQVSNGQPLETGFPFSTKTITIPLASGTSPEFRVKLENLPPGYTVKSVRYGTTDITNSTLKVTGPSASLQTYTSTVGPGGTTVRLVVTGPTPTGPTLAIVLTAPAATPSPASNGVQVTGKLQNAEPRSIFLSGMPGILYSDGTFEFRGVSPGRHTISTPDNPSSSQPQAASVVVGTQDVRGIELVRVPLLPIDIRNATAAPSGNHATGALPLAVVHGKVVDNKTGEPIPGTAYINGTYASAFELDAEGRFEIPRLLPGNYNMEIRTFAHDVIQRTLIVGEDDISLNLATPSTVDTP